MTQAEVAGKLGLCRTWVAKIEGCELALDLLGLVRICRVYGIEAKDAIGMMEEG